MGQEQQHVVNTGRRFFAGDETTYGTMVRALSAHGFKADQVEVGFDRKRGDRTDNRDTRSKMERIAGEIESKWKLKSKLIPSGSLGVAPDLDVVFRTAIGRRDVNVGASVIYSRDDTQGAHGSFTLTDYQRHMMRVGVGCYVDDWSISSSGSEPPVFEASGLASTAINTYATTLLAAMDASAALSASAARNLRIGSVVSVGANVNAGAGYRVTAGTGNPFTLESAITAAISADVLPFAPEADTQGTWINGLSGGVTIDGVGNVDFTACKVTGKNNHQALRRGLSAIISDYNEGEPEIGGSVSLRLRRDQLVYLSLRETEDFDPVPLVFTFGSVAGQMVVVSVPRAELQMSEVNYPEKPGELAVVEIPFIALGTTGADEIEVRFQ